MRILLIKSESFKYNISLLNKNSYTIIFIVHTSIIISSRLNPCYLLFSVKFSWAIFTSNRTLGNDWQFASRTFGFNVRSHDRLTCQVDGQLQRAGTIKCLLTVTGTKFKTNGLPQLVIEKFHCKRQFWNLEREQKYWKVKTSNKDKKEQQSKTKNERR